jgi:acetyl-CoA synthetase
LVAHPAIVQVYVIGQSHDIKGQSICTFCMLKNGFNEMPELVAELRVIMQTEVGAFCMPDLIMLTSSLPMTRTGKIMHHILRKIVCKEMDTLGNTSTLVDPSIVDTLINKVESLKEAALV